MANYQLGPVIGQLGGGGAEIISAEGETFGNDSAQLATFDPKGKHVRVFLLGHMDYSGSVGRAYLTISSADGEEDVTDLGDVLHSWTASERFSITIENLSNRTAATFSGHVYVVPLP